MKTKNIVSTVTLNVSNMNKNKIFLCLLASLFFSCSGKQQQGNEAPEISLQAITLKTDTALMNNHVYRLIDNTLIVYQSAAAGAYLSACQIKNDSIIQLGTFLRKGSGPYELPVLPRIIPDSKSKKLHIYHCTNASIIYTIPYPLQTNLLQTSTWEVIRNKVKPNFFWGNSPCSMQLFGDSTFITIGGAIKEGEENSYVINKYNPYTHQNTPIQGFNFRKELPGNNIIKRRAYNEAYLFRQSDKNRFAYINSRGKYFCLFDIEEDTVKNFKTVLDQFPAYSVAKDGKNFNYDQNGFQGMEPRFTPHHIYLGEPPYASIKEWVEAGPYKGYSSDSFDRILVYDWDGNHVSTLLLNKPVTNFIVTEDDSCIYASCENLEEETETIIKYNLPGFSNNGL